MTGRALTPRRIRQRLAVRRYNRICRNLSRDSRDSDGVYQFVQTEFGTEMANEAIDMRGWPDWMLLEERASRREDGVPALSVELELIRRGLRY